MTAQFPDVLHFRGTTLSLCTLPLETYFRQFPRPPAMRGLHRHTACMRGYQAIWEVADNQLYLNKIITLHDEDLPLQIVFSTALQRVHASWYSGILRCPQGKLLRYVHDSFRSVFERDLLITITNGIVQSEIDVSNPIAPPSPARDDDDIPAFLKQQSSHTDE